MLGGETEGFTYKDKLRDADRGAEAGPARRRRRRGAILFKGKGDDLPMPDLGMLHRAGRRPAHQERGRPAGARRTARRSLQNDGGSFKDKAD